MKWGYIMPQTCPKFSTQFALGRHSLQCCCQLSNIAGLDEKRVSFIFQEVWNRADRCAYYRQTKRPRFEKNHRQPFVVTRQHEERRISKLFIQFFAAQRTGKCYFVFKAEVRALLQKRFPFALEFPRADKHQLD